MITKPSLRSEGIKPISVNARIYTRTEGSLEENYYETFIFEVLDSKKSVDPTNGTNQRVLMITNKTPIIHVVEEIEIIMATDSFFKNRCKFSRVRYSTYENKYTFVNGTNLSVMSMSSVPNVTPHSDKITKELSFVFIVEPAVDV